MTTLVQPDRCLLDAAQLAAALAVAGVTPAPDSPLVLPPAPADPVAALRGTPLVHDGGIAEGWREALAVLAAPGHVVSIAAGVAGSPRWVTSVISCGPAAGPFVAHPGDGRFDLALLPTPTDAVLYADELLEITAGPSGEGDVAVTLDLAGVAAFAALADALQRAKLQALLDRRTEYATTWTVADLDALLAEGLAADDTRWATTAMHHTAPVPLAEAIGRLDEGVAELARAGLVQTGGGGWTLTPTGQARVAAFGQLVNTGVISTAETGADGGLASATAGIFRTVLGVWLLTWDVSGTQVQAVLEEVTAGRALEFVSSLLRPA